MMINVEQAGRYGIVRDPRPHALPEEAWSSGLNVRFRDGYAEKFSGQKEIYSSPPINPYFVLPTIDLLNQYWILAGTSAIYVHDGSTYTNLSRAGGYNMTASGKWTGGYLAGLAFLNNPADHPQYWNLDTAGDFADLPNWEVGEETIRCRVMRPFLNQLIIGDVLVDSTRYPTLVKWSAVADPGTVPGSWDVSSTTEQTGQTDLADTPGFVIDMAPMGRSNMVYKEDAVVAMTYVGRTFVYEFEWLSKIFGLFSQNCVVQQGSLLRQIAFGYDDVVAVEGRNIRSILDTKNRRWLYNNIDVDNQYNSFVVSNEQQKETWVCFPANGDTWCTMAMVYDWTSESWGVRELPDLVHAASGVFDEGASPQVWDNQTTLLWDDALQLWDTREIRPSSRALIGAGNTETFPLLYQFDKTEQFDGLYGTNSFEAKLERLALSVTITRRGNVIRDFENRKLIKRIIPHVEGTGNMKIYVGGQETVDGPVTWDGPHVYEIGSKKDIEVWFSTLLPAFRFESDGNQMWKMSGFSFEQENVGKHW
jgi:hypothetical protein